MRDLFGQIRTANSARLYFVALFAALTLPDICAALEAPDGQASGSQYIAWFDAHVAPMYGVAGSTTLTGRVAYRFRCSMLHQATTQDPKNAFSRILFIEPGTTGIVAHNNVINGALNIDAQVFVDDVVRAAESWFTAAQSDPTVQMNYARSIQRHPGGLPPYIVGVPVIS